MTGNSARPFRHEVRIALRRAALITKKGDGYAASYADSLAGWLKMRGVEVGLNTISPSEDLVVVLGGDGTLLHIAEDAARHRIPVLGINLGNLGFLTEFTEKESFPALESILAGPISVENRLMLKARITRGGQTEPYRYALNDVVIAKNVLDRLLNLSTSADDEYITTYRADGLIFSSPTGSTAYNLSAGGPLVYPGLETITVTPICPFMLSSRPIILPAAMRITTRFETTSASQRAQVIVDGQSFWEIGKGDILEVATARHPLKLIVSNGRDYFTIVRNKLHWGSPASKVSHDPNVMV
ncbi:MAG TPA: NAD(+)/NADH kinase [Desulforhopalus sp.]|nr:NAD(+)/NADH kinase [Desulforhopalus sp.]